MNNQIEGKWLRWCVAAWLVVHFSLFSMGNHRLQQEQAPLVFVFGLLIFYSIPLTMWLVGIPSRVAINLLIRDRRRAKWKETLLLMVTFLALSSAIYTMMTFTEHG